MITWSAIGATGNEKRCLKAVSLEEREPGKPIAGHRFTFCTHWQVIGDTEATVYCLTKGVAYFVTVDAYNESGVTKGTELQKI